jgi:DNA-binding transcriptional ArsR family regulator
VHKRLLLLGLLRHGPLSGYELNRIVRAHGDLYADLKKANIYYLLTRLAEDGLVEVEVQPGARGRRGERLVYRLTAVGKRVETIDLIGSDDLGLVADAIAAGASRAPGPLEAAGLDEAAPQTATLRPGGKRSPLRYDPKGNFVISLAPDDREIVLVHYGPDRLPAHEMRGRTAEPMLLGLLWARLVTQLSHAGYLGAELAKAESALRL